MKCGSENGTFGRACNIAFSDCLVAVMMGKAFRVRKSLKEYLLMMIKQYFMVYKKVFVDDESSIDRYWQYKHKVSTTIC